MRICLAAYMKNPNIGLFGVVTEEFCLLPKPTTSIFKKQIAGVLGVPIICSNIAGTELVGALCVAEGKTLLVPEIAFEREVAFLKKQGLQVKLFKTDQTALGNNIALGNKRGIAGHGYTDSEIERLSKLFETKIIKRSMLGLNTLGSLLYVTPKGGVVHNEASDPELKIIEKHFKVKLVRASVNRGNPYVSMGVLANSKGVVVGELTRGAELTQIQEGLGVV